MQAVHGMHAMHGHAACACVRVMHAHALGACVRVMHAHADDA